MPHFDKETVLAACVGRWPDFFGQYLDIHQQGREWKGLCPFHDDRNPSFSLNVETGWYHCFACKEGGDVFTFLQKKEGLTFGDALLLLGGWAGVVALPDRPANRPAPKPARAPKTEKTAPTPEGLFSYLGKIEDVYDYTDEDGTLLFKTVRLRKPDGKKTFRQCRPDGEGWIDNITGVRRVLYNLPEVTAAVMAGKIVFIVEGEKDVESLRSLGLCATTNPMGAGKWEDSYSEILCGAGVVILPDADQIGRDHTQGVAASLNGRAKRIRVVQLPVSEKGDVSDWLEAGGTKDELARLVKAAPDWTPPAPAPTSQVETDPQAKSVACKSSVRKTIAERVISLRDVPNPPAERPYLFGPYLNEAAAHFLVGITGIGKSTLLYNLLAALAEGREHWDVPCKPRRILYLDMESGTIGRSMKASRLFQDRADRPGLGNLLFMQEALRLPQELDDLLDYVQAERIELVIFDTVRRCFPVRDENDNAEVYRNVIPSLDALKQIGVASLTLGHPAKNGIGASARGAGAQEDAGDVNLTLTMHNGADKNDPNGILVLRVTKNRLLGEMNIPPLYLQRIGDDQFERVEIEGAAQSETITRRMECRDLVMGRLDQADGERVSFDALLQAVKPAGISKATLQRTLKNMEKENDITHMARGGYALGDPFAEDSVDG